MKQFFKMFLASLTGFIAGSGCFVILLFMGLSAMIAGLSMKAFKGEETPIELKAGTILKLDLSSLDEIAYEEPFAGLFSSSSSEPPLSLSETIKQIHKAKNNPKIEAIYLTTENLSAGLAAIQSVRDALLDFKKSGKPIVAYADNYSQKGYYLSSIADKIIINPLGSLGLLGVSAGNLMLGDALEKFGVKMEVFRVGTFKGAVEPFTLNRMSDANRQQTQEYIDGLWSSIVSGIAKARGLTKEQILAFANRGDALSPAELFVKEGFIDTIAYKQDVASIFGELLEQDEDDLRMVSLSQLKGHDSSQDYDDNVIRVLYAEGDITDSEPNKFASRQESTINAKLISQIEEVAKDEDVKAVVLRLNTPGGSAFLSEQIHQALLRLKAEKPLVISMGNVAASGGYYIASAGNEIFAHPTTITGSIGVFGLIPNASKLASQYGLHVDIVKTSDLADLNSLSPLTPLRDEQRLLIQKSVERTYEIFLERVSQGRNITRAQADAVGQGRVWLGSKALELGLVDKLGGLEDAIKSAAQLAQLGDDYMVDHGSTSVSLWDELFSESKSSTDFVARLRYRLASSEERKLLRLLETTTTYAGIQARLPYEYPTY